MNTRFFHGTLSDQEALDFHSRGRPGKLEITPTKPISNQRDLSLAYTPGVAAPVLAIAKNPSTVYDYTTKGNTVAVITNGSAILGLGNKGPLAAKPVMEGKAVLFKRFADIDAVDLEIQTHNVDDFVNCVRCLAPSFGGINLEDIAAPDCFIMEKRLIEEMNIPVFHDDQHGTAIIVVAALINALYITGRSPKNVRVVLNGAGAAGIACLELLAFYGISQDNMILCDTAGIIYKGRQHNMNPWKEKHAVPTSMRTLADALKGADVFIGVSSKDLLTEKMLRSMAKDPIIFALANPDPEILPNRAHAIRKDAIIATGRSDFPNQVNNVLGFPYVFRGALDTRASHINRAMKIACAQALAALARTPIPDEVIEARAGDIPHFGPSYLIPDSFDPRLIRDIPAAVALKAVETGVGKLPCKNMETYKDRLWVRRNPAAPILQNLFIRARREEATIVFADGEDERVIRAALWFQEMKIGTAVLIGNRDTIGKRASRVGINLEKIAIEDPAVSHMIKTFAPFLQEQLGGTISLRDCQRLVARNESIFAACMVALGQANGMLTGVRTHYSMALNDLCRVLCEQKESIVMGASVLFSRGRTILMADTSVYEKPDARTLARCAIATAHLAKELGLKPCVAFPAHVSSWQKRSEVLDTIREALFLLDEAPHVDFDYHGVISIDAALDREQRRKWAFSDQQRPDANILILPSVHVGEILLKMQKCLHQDTTILGPILLGLEHSAQIVHSGCHVSDIVNMATVACLRFDASTPHISQEFSNFITNPQKTKLSL